MGNEEVVGVDDGGEEDAALVVKERFDLGVGGVRFGIVFVVFSGVDSFGVDLDGLRNVSCIVDCVEIGPDATVESTLADFKVGGV